MTAFKKSALFATLMLSSLFAVAQPTSGSFEAGVAGTDTYQGVVSEAAPVEATSFEALSRPATPAMQEISADYVHGKDGFTLTARIVLALATGFGLLPIIAYGFLAFRKVNELPPAPPAN